MFASAEKRSDVGKIISDIIQTTSDIVFPTSNMILGVFEKEQAVMVWCHL